MSITPLGGQERLRAATASRANPASNGASPAGAPRQPDRVSISDKARSLGTAHAAVAAATDVREDRVSALKAAIADGTYSVDSRRLAARLLEHSNL